MLIAARSAGYAPASPLRAPQRAATPNSVEPTDSVETSPVKPANPEGPKRSGLYCAACASLKFLVGPVAHGLGKALTALDMVPPKSQPSPPPNPLKDLPDSNITTPVLLVHGWHTKLEFFKDLTEKLSDTTAFVKNGQFYADPECTQKLEQPSPDMKVFLSVFSDNRLSPTDTAPELKANVDAVRKLTGHQEIDALGYSMGGLATQAHLDQNEDHGIRNFMMLGTPNQGAGLAGLVALALDNEVNKGHDLRWLLDIKDIQPEDKLALEWLRPTSPLREDLHSRWDQQKAKVKKVLHVGAKSETTPGSMLWPTRGDGTVTARSLELPDLEVKYVQPHGIYGDHKNLLSNPDTYLTMRDFFGWA